MTLAEPAHRDLPALALDLLRLDRAALLGDIEERFEQQPPLRSAAREPARLVGTRQRIKDCLDRRDAPRVLARDRVDAAQHPHQVEERLGHERRRHVRGQHLLGLRPGATLELREDRALVDARVDPLLEHAGGFLLGERHDARDEVAARHRSRVERDELVEEQDRQAALFLFRFGRGGRHHRWNVWLGPRMDADGTAPLRRAPRRLGEDGLVRLSVVGP